MKILAIETSCDETAVAIVEAKGDEDSAQFRVLGNVLLSQIDLHRSFLRRRCQYFLKNMNVILPTHRVCLQLMSLIYY